MQRHDHSPGTGLDEADRKRLAAALAGAREARVYRRLEALLLVAEGHSVAEAARRCRVNRSSVHRWLAQYKAEHEATALMDRPRSGRPRRHPRLTPQRLAAALARDPRRCGYQATSWTVPLLAHDLAAKGLAVSPQTLRRRLHEAGYRWKRRAMSMSSAQLICRRKKISWASERRIGEVRRSPHPGGRSCSTRPQQTLHSRTAPTRSI
ncbi:helix-turn-helix domain-containing protein, partial [Microvirga tunisiensis]